MIEFGRDAEYVSDLKLSQKRSGRQQLVQQLIGHMSDELDNITNLEKGLKKAFDAHEEYDTLQITKNDRTDAKNIVVVFTDGKTHNQSAISSLQKVKRHFIAIFALIIFIKINFTWPASENQVKQWS